MNQSVSSITPEHEQERPLLTSVRERFAGTVGTGRPLFTTDAQGLWSTFLFLLPEDLRQTYTCHACRRFVETYGGLVTVDDSGNTSSVMWGTCEAPFADAVHKLNEIVSHARITGVFLSGERVWGLPQNRDTKHNCTWHHMAVIPPATYVRKASVLKTDGQAMAEKLEDYQMLQRGLADFPVDIVRNAVNLLTNGQLYRSEKCEAVARWLLELHEQRDATKNTRRRDNLTWLAVANAPAGFAHVRSGMIGTLLEDLQSGMEFSSVKRRWDEKMHPLQYMRPQAQPGVGNIAQAERMVGALRSSGALDRRFAKLEDLRPLWTPKAVPPETPDGGVFSHLLPKGHHNTPQVEAPPALMTWEKFARTALPEAQRIEFMVPVRGNFIALVTAANTDAPPMLQWDREGDRNPLSWYVYMGGSPASRFNLRCMEWCDVTAITLLPPMYHPQPLESWGKGAILILEDCQDIEHQRGGGMFPESMRSEYHEVRKTIEAYFKSTSIAGKGETTACGYDLRAGNTWDVTIRVTTKTGRTTYKLDRWD